VSGAVGLVLAAGRSTRMGRPKQLAELAGRPMLDYAVAAMTAAPLDRVVVALGAHACRVRDGADLRGVEVFEAPGWREGMGRVLGEAAARYGPDCDALVVTLGDQPLLTPAAVAAVVGAWEAGAGPVVRAVYGGRPGHPVLFARPALDRLPALRGDDGARELLRDNPGWLRTVELGLAGDDMDVDDEIGLERARVLLRARGTGAGDVGRPAGTPMAAARRDDRPEGADRGHAR
jgi:molybdenum cofactor cytidylyltransferase